MTTIYRERNGYLDRAASGLDWCLYEQYITFQDDDQVTMHSVNLRGAGQPARGEPENRMKGRVTRRHPPNSQGEKVIEFAVENKTTRIVAEAVVLGTGELICGLQTERKDLDVGPATSSHLFHREE